MCCTWSTLDEIFSFIKKKNSGFILQPCVVRGLPLFIKKNCDFYCSTMCCTWFLLKKKKSVVCGLPTLDQIFSFIKKLMGNFKNQSSVKIGKKLKINVNKYRIVLV